MRRILLILLTLLSGLPLLAQARYDYFYMEAEKCRLADDYPSAMALYQHCLDIRPGAAAPLYNLGLIQLYLRNDSVGTALLKRACDLDARNPWYLESLASLYLSRRHTDEAAGVLEKMATLQSRRSDILAQLAQIYQSKGEHDKAISTLNRIELLEGKSAQLSLQKFDLYKEKDQLDSAFQELQSLCDEFPHDMNYKVILGNQYQEAGDKAKASEIYSEVRRKDPTNENLQFSMLGYYQDTGDTARFQSLRDSLLYSPSTSTDLRVALMRAYIEDTQSDSTRTPAMLQAFDKVLAMPQKDAQLLTLKAAYQIYTKQGEDSVACTMRRILEVVPGNEAAMSQLLQYYTGRNDAQHVEEICRMGVNYHPEELAYSYYLGVALYQQERNEEAREVFQQGIRAKGEDANPALVSDVFALLGDLYFTTRQEQEAFAAYDSALVYKPDNVSCLNNYAYYLSLRDEQLDKAEEMSYRTIKAEPRNITYLDTYAWILFMKGDYTNARMYEDQVINPAWSDDELLANDSIQGNLIEHAGDIYSLCGQTVQAVRYWKLALRKKDDTCTANIRKKLKKKKYIK